jgi:hypothetical protein
MEKERQFGGKTLDDLMVLAAPKGICMDNELE